MRQSCRRNLSSPILILTTWRESRSIERLWILNTRNTRNTILNKTKNSTNYRVNISFFYTRRDPPPPPPGHRTAATALEQTCTTSNLELATMDTTWASTNTTNFTFQQWTSSPTALVDLQQGPHYPNDKVPLGKLTSDKDALFQFSLHKFIDTTNWNKTVNKLIQNKKNFYLFLNFLVI